MEAHNPKNRRNDRSARPIKVLQKLFAYTWNVMRNILISSNICILGMDGTGKTSVAQGLKKMMGDQAEIQYMGSKIYITLYARKRLSKAMEREAGILRIAHLTAGLFEMWYRVIRHWPYDKRVIFDRYAWERYLFLHGIDRVIGRMLYRTLFPKPRHIFYLYCPAELSFARKNDIHDKAKFVKKKELYDKEFLNHKHIMAINTAVNDVNATLDLIAKVCSKVPEVNLTKKTKRKNGGLK